jgi:uridine kinase
VTLPPEDLLRAITDRGRALRGRPVVVAVDGHSAVGKSTMARSLSVKLGAAVVPCDDFYRDEPEEVRLAYDAAEGVRRYFDWERMATEAVLPLRTNMVATYRPFDWQAGRGLGNEVTIEPAPILILEGVYSARPELRSHLDLAVLVQAPAATRLRRQRERHDPHDWERRWDLAERHYFKTVCPQSAFDFIISGESE